jgi:hypothetical protein
MKKLCFVLLLHSLFTTGIGVAAGELPRTRIALREGRWMINDQTANPGSAAEGLLMNVRMVNDVFEDRSKPDFDPEANADRFIAKIPDYAAHGVNAFTTGKEHAEATGITRLIHLAGTSHDEMERLRLLRELEARTDLDATLRADLAKLPSPTDNL